MKACPNPNCAHTLPPQLAMWAASVTRAIRCPCCRLRGPWANNDAEAERLWDALPRQEDADNLRALLRAWDAKCQGHCNTEDIAAQVEKALG